MLFKGGAGAGPRVDRSEPKVGGGRGGGGGTSCILSMALEATFWVPMGAQKPYCHQMITQTQTHPRGDGRVSEKIDFLNIFTKCRPTLKWLGPHQQGPIAGGRGHEATNTWLPSAPATQASGHCPRMFGSNGVYALFTHFCYVGGIGDLGDPVVPTLRGLIGDVVTVYAY